MALSWADWHKAYEDPDSALSARLRIVQEYLREVLDRCAPGPLRLISVCAGQGHDVVGALQDHPRCNDVSATLIELDPDNVRAARERVAAAGLSNVQVVEGDASRTDIYHKFVPAEVVLVCGLFGNLSEADIRRTINYLPMLCAAGASVLWTRGGSLAEQIRRWFAEDGFDEVSYTMLPSHSIGVNRFLGTPVPLQTGVQLFTFKSSLTLHVTEGTLSIRGLRLHYRSWGDPAAPVLVALHGLLGSAEVWWRLAVALDGWRLVALDQRGRGASDWAPDADYSRAACLVDFEEFADALQLDRFALLGDSDSGAIALAYTLKHPEKVEKLMLEDMGAPSERALSLRAQLAELPLSFASWEQAADYQRRRNPKLPEQRLKASLPHVFRERSDGTITWKYDLAGLRQFDPARDASFNPWPELGRVACPVLVVRGHNAHLDNAAAFNAEVLAFLKRS